MCTRIRVVGAVILQGDSILACRRRAGLSAAGLWEFPGGKVEVGETPQQALVREIREELGVDLIVGELVHREATIVGSNEIDLACYLCSLRGDTPAASSDHDRLVWQRQSALEELAWSAPDLPTVHVLSSAR